MNLNTIIIKIQTLPMFFIIEYKHKDYQINLSLAVFLNN